MKLCWDNIENIRLTKNDNFRDVIKGKTYYLKTCKKCGKLFFGLSVNNLFCDKRCSNLDNHHTEETKKKLSLINMGENNPNYGKHLSEETKRKLSESQKGEKAYWYGKHLPKETRKKMSKSRRGQVRDIEARKNLSKSKLGKKNPQWKGGYASEKIPMYDTYAPQIDWIDEVRRNKDNSNILEVKCIKCDRWFIPIRQNVISRIQYLKGNYGSEYRFYCSEECKKVCPIYAKKTEQIMKEDAIRAGRLGWLELNREVQPQLRQMVLERDEYKCVKCGSNDTLHCHHILPVAEEPLLSADVDNCITLCEECHKEVHKQDGCRTGQLRMEICI